MKYWKELPYRGDGKPIHIKPRRRFGNLKRERREIIISILMIIGLFFLTFVFGSSPSGDDTTKTGILIFGSIFALVLIAGVRSLTRFRKGYDIDIAEETDPENSKDSEK